MPKPKKMVVAMPKTMVSAGTVHQSSVLKVARCAYRVNRRARTMKMHTAGKTVAAVHNHAGPMWMLATGIMDCGN